MGMIMYVIEAIPVWIVFKMLKCLGLIDGEYRLSERWIWSSFLRVWNITSSHGPSAQYNPTGLLYWAQR